MVTPVAVLIGPPGAGTSTVGSILADLLGVDLHDIDARIEEVERRSVADIFIDSGEPYFRDVERAVVLHALAAHAGVVALGGGAPLDPDVQRALAGRPVVFVDVAIADAAKRVGFDASRPVSAVNPRARWIALMAERRPTYERLAAHHVHTDGKTPDEVAAEIAALLGAA